MPENSKYKTNIERLKSSMLSYMEIAGNPYSKDDIEETANILIQYLNQIEKSNSKEEGMKIVKNTVEKLNKLNEKCNSQLIETDEREQIAEIIILASSDKGYNKYEDDITEEWREW